MPGRLRSLRRRLGKLDAALVATSANLRYLTGFTGSSGAALVTHDRAFFITDFRYAERSKKEISGDYETVITSRPPLMEAIGLAARLKVKRAGFERGITYASFKAINDKGIKLCEVSDKLSAMRERKDEQEMAHIREAVRRAEQAFMRVKPRMHAGVTERSIALRLETEMKRLGADRAAFDIIVASGENSAMPHAAASDRKLRPGDLLTIDWGAEAGGYFSDMTRTFLVGPAGKGEALARKGHLYSLVKRANEAGIRAAKAGAGCKQVDRAARNIIERGGHGPDFGHGLGHGVGIEVHEAPRLSPRGKGRLAAGNVVTVEPGVYVAGLGGVRIEDMLYIAPAGEADVLTSLPRELEIL